MENKNKILQQRETMLMEIQFIRFISDIGTNTMRCLGRLRNPETNKIDKNVDRAEKLLYILEMLQDKTKNNLTDSERQHLLNTIGTLKMVFYEEKNQNAVEQRQKEAINVRHILVGNKEQAFDIHADLKKGSDFEELARTYSLCNSRDNGGFLSNVTRGSLPSVIEERVFGLNKDEISDPLESIMGFHIFKLIEKASHVQEENTTHS